MDDETVQKIAQVLYGFRPQHETVAVEIAGAPAKITATVPWARANDWHRQRRLCEARAVFGALNRRD